MATILVESGNLGYTSVDGVLFNSDMTTLIQCPAGLSGTYSIPDSVTTIGREAFGNCHSLTSIGIPDTVTTLGDWAFFHCDGLTRITLPQRVDSIGSYAFEGCRRLTTFTIPASVTRIETGAWDGCTALTAILVDTGNTAYSSRDGVLFDASFTILLRYPIGLSGSYVIPGGVSTIADHAFQNCKQLTTLTIPDGVTMIGDSAFQNCTALIALTIPGSVTTIGDRAFQNCGELTSVTIPPSITRIGESAFRDCRRLGNALFLGDAPLLGSGAFRNTASSSRTDPGFTIYHLAGSSGFPTPTWDEKPTVSIDLEVHPAAPWLLTHTLPYDSDLDLDLNGNGVSLLLAYALDLDPNMNLAGSMPIARMGPDTMSISFYGERPGISYTVEFSDDMMTWDKDRVTLSEPDASGYRTATIDRDSPRRFLRLLV
ncbi:MAG: leucine-rich repeat domain-containing protein, partial [Akkermansiaceae bacterium]|nr:leucine-rich repeat domain-containing protein [Akkermansiaceae bacterium]